MREHLALVLEVIGVCLLGIMSGFVFAFAVDVAPAMENLDAAAYVTVQQWINRVVRNITFGAVYFGSTIVPFLAAVAVFWSGNRTRAIAWLAIAVAYFLAVFWVTRAVNVPINNELASWQPSVPQAIGSMPVTPGIKAILFERLPLLGALSPQLGLSQPGGPATVWSSNVRRQVRQIRASAVKRGYEGYDD